MFSALSQGSTIYILDKQNTKIKLGTIVAISYPKMSYNLLTNTIDIKCTIDGITLEYNNIPGNYSIVSYNNGLTILSETKQGLLQEIESVLGKAEEIVSNVAKYKQLIIDCELLLKELNPLFAKDKERDERLDNLESKIDKLINLMNK